GEFLTLDLLIKKGFAPLDYRFFCLGAHYRAQLHFSFEALESARKSRRNLMEKIAVIQREADNARSESQNNSANENQGNENLGLEDISVKARGYLDDFRSFLSRDLNMPRCLSVLWKLVKDSDVMPQEKLALIKDMDSVLGLKLMEAAPQEEEEVVLDKESLALIKEREEARKRKDYSRADQIRDILLKKGIEIKDTPSGTDWRKKL
ncbi:MAG: cysteine--tRNA ligase, partial [Spirochaetia bacterium]|nr:cysteine--tRNA ligase [Spirochaetia bacterium]